MRSFFATLRQLVLPAGSLPGSPRLLFGPDIPAELVTFYAGSPFGQPLFACIRGEISTTKYEYEAFGSDGIFVWRHRGAFNGATVRHRTTELDNKLQIGYALGQVQELHIIGNGPGLFRVFNAATIQLDAGAIFTVEGVSQLGNWDTGFSTTWGNSGTANTLGDGTLTFRFLQTGKTIRFRLRLTWGSTTASGSGTWRFTLPSLPDSNEYSFTATAFDTSAGLRYPCVGVGDSVLGISQLGTPTGALMNATVPFTWAAGDSLVINGVYQKA